MTESLDDFRQALESVRYALQDEKAWGLKLLNRSEQAVMHAPLPIDPPLMELPAARTAGSDPQPQKAESGESFTQRLQVLQVEIRACTRCDLHKARTQTVFARGNPQAELVFVGEGPGYHEDQQGLPFVGPAGQLLDKMIQAMGYEREHVYICNVVKCRPPDNRTPLPNEMAACASYLEQQLEVVQPRAIVALGKCAATALGALNEGASGWRGTWKTWNNVPLMSTYHPAFLLRNPEHKRVVWEDSKKVMAHLGKKPVRA